MCPFIKLQSAQAQIHIPVNYPPHRFENCPLTKLSSWWFQTAGFYIFQHFYKMAMKSMRSEQRAESTLLLVQTRPIVQVVVANEVMKPLYLSPKTQGSPWFYLLKVECLCYLVVTLMFYVYMLPPHLREKISGVQEYWVSRIQNRFSIPYVCRWQSANVDNWGGSSERASIRYHSLW